MEGLDRVRTNSQCDQLTLDGCFTKNDSAATGRLGNAHGHLRIFRELKPFLVS